MSDRRWVLAFALFVLALLSKTVTCSLPAALLLVTWWKRGRITRQDIIPLLPLFAIGLLLAIFTAYWEREHVLAIGPEWELSLINRILIAGRAAWFYLTKLLLPVGLSFIYPKWMIDPAQAWQWALPAGVAVALIALWLMRNRWGRGPVVAALIFIGTLAPALGFFNIYPMRYTYVADHFQYHASAAMIALIAAGVSRLGRGGYVLVVPLLFVTFLRVGVFRDPEALWRDTLDKNPNSWMVHLNLGKTLVARDRNSEAFPHFARLVELAPDLPEAHWNYGSSLFLAGRYDDAFKAYDEAIRLAAAHPLNRNNPLPRIYYARGHLFRKLGRNPEAIADFHRYEQTMQRIRQSSPGALPSPPP